MPAPFFPHLAFAWAFVVVLSALLTAASYLDTKTMRVPKILTLSALVAGLLFNLVRGLWVGGQGRAVWLLGENGPVVGSIDGLLFGIAGLILGFAIFFLMWVLGACGGGDVKLFAAVGAWIGPLLAVYVLAVTIPVILGFMFLRILLALPKGLGAMRRMAKPGDGKTERRKRLLAFSMPVTLATVLVLLWAFRADLHLLPKALPAHAKAQGGTDAH
jgi:prepilin peptidase CpaA